MDKFGVEIHNMNSDGFVLHRETGSKAITPLLSEGQYFLDNMRVNVMLPRNQKGPEKNNEPCVLSGL